VNKNLRAHFPWSNLYFPRGRADLVPFSLGHISRQDLLVKILKDRDEVAVSIAVSCFMPKKLTRIHDYFLSKLFPRYLLDQLKNHFRLMRSFLAKDYANQANIHNFREE